MIANTETPIWHSVSCVCTECIAADEHWITRYGYSLAQLVKRPLFHSVQPVQVTASTVTSAAL